MSFMTPYARSEVLLSAGAGDVVGVDSQLAALLPDELAALEQACDLLLDRISHRLAGPQGTDHG